MFFELPAPTSRGVEAVARGYQEVGVRAVIAPMMADITFFRAIPGLLDTLPLARREQVNKLSATPYTEQLRIYEEIYTNWTFDRGYLRPAIAPSLGLNSNMRPTNERNTDTFGKRFPITFFELNIHKAYTHSGRPRSTGVSGLSLGLFCFLQDHLSLQIARPALTESDIRNAFW